MKFLRRNWALLLAAALIPLVILLAVLQQDWIRQMGERERIRLRQGLFVAGGELVSAFQRELLLAPLAIATPPAEATRADSTTPSASATSPSAGTRVASTGTPAPKKSAQSAETGLRLRLPEPYTAALASGNWSFFAERWRGWKNYALDPDIVAAVHLVQVHPGRTPIVRSWDGRAFSMERDLGLAAKIRSTLDSDEERHMGDSDLIRVDDEEWDIVPVPEARGLILVIRYDLKTLIDKVLPRLAELHLGAMTDYRFRIVDRESGEVLYRTDAKGGDAGFDQPDLRMGLFRLSFGSPDSLVSAIRNADGADANPFSALSQKGLKGRERDDQIASFYDRLLGESVWTIEAVHRNGSLADIVRASIIRNLLASTGILLLLAVAIVVLALSNRRAQALAARQEEFVASVTHELKTPLAVIGSAASNLADGIVRDSEGMQRYGKTIGGETRRLVAMIDKLLLYTRLGATRVAGEDSVDIGALADSVIAERGPELEALGFRVEKSLPKEALFVKGDENALRLVLANLVANVIVHAAKGAYLGVFVAKETQRRNGELVAVRVDDRGPGIPRRERAAVFEAFFRGRLARDRQEPGSGIGLNLVRRVTQAHGGGVTLESAEGFGTSVTVTLPIGQKGREDGKA